MIFLLAEGYKLLSSRQTALRWRTYGGMGSGKPFLDNISAQFILKNNFLVQNDIISFFPHFISYHPLLDMLSCSCTSHALSNYSLVWYLSRMKKSFAFGYVKGKILGFECWYSKRKISGFGRFRKGNLPGSPKFSKKKS